MTERATTAQASEHRSPRRDEDPFARFWAARGLRLSLELGLDVDRGSPQAGQLAAVCAAYCRWHRLYRLVRRALAEAAPRGQALRAEADYSRVLGRGLRSERALSLARRQAADTREDKVRVLAWELRHLAAVRDDHECFLAAPDMHPAARAGLVRELAQVEQRIEGIRAFLIGELSSGTA
jgi:hypothetical protein